MPEPLLHTVKNAVATIEHLGKPSDVSYSPFAARSRHPHRAGGYRETGSIASNGYSFVIGNDEGNRKIRRPAMTPQRDRLRLTDKFN